MTSRRSSVSPVDQEANFITDVVTRLLGVERLGHRHPGGAPDTATMNAAIAAAVAAHAATAATDAELAAAIAGSTGVFTPTTNWTVDAQFSLSKIGNRVIAQATIRNATGAGVATPVTIATIPAAFRPTLGSVFDSAYGTLGSMRVEFTTGGSVIATLNAGGTIANTGYVAFSTAYTI